MTEVSPGAKLSRWERGGLITLLVLFVAFGVLVEIRSAFLKRRMGDLGCYLYAAWAVRTGNDLYAVTFNGWHYNYPPLLAIAMVPLAASPDGVDLPGYLPYAVSAGIWYVLSLLCLFLAVHWLANALERTSTWTAMQNRRRGSRHWWALRLLPMLACLPPIGHTLMRGQVNLLVLALLCGSIAAVLHQRRFLGGLCLAATICIKIYPAFLLLYPLWRRDLRYFAGCGAGLLIGLVLVPLAEFGPQRTIEHYQTLGKVLIGPALGAGEDQTRAKELIDVPATDSQSFLAVLHNTLHLERATRPRQAADSVRLVSLVLGGVLTLLALWGAGWNKSQNGPREVLFFGLLILNMLLLCPVCHLHYFCMIIPIFMGLIACRWETSRQQKIGLGLVLLLAGYFAANVPPQIPGQEFVRDAGLAMYASLLVWLAGLVMLRRQDKPLSQEIVESSPARRAA